MEEKKEFIEPLVIRYEEMLDEVTMGGPPMGSPPEDLKLPEDS